MILTANPLNGYCTSSTSLSLLTKILKFTLQIYLSNKTIVGLISRSASFSRPTLLRDLPPPHSSLPLPFSLRGDRGEGATSAVCRARPAFFDRTLLGPDVPACGRPTRRRFPSVLRSQDYLAGSSRIFFVRGSPPISLIQVSFCVMLYGSVQQKRATERTRCLFRVKGALFNSLIIVCCVIEKKLSTY